LPLVPMPAVIGLSYVDFCFIVEDGQKFKFDMDALWRTIAPKIPKDPSDHLPPGENFSDASIQSEHLSKWRNTWCDVVSAYSHIHQLRDVFVTNNTRDFQANKEKLSALGMRHIATPSEVLTAVDKIRLDDK